MSVAHVVALVGDRHGDDLDVAISDDVDQRGRVLRSEDRVNDRSENACEALGFLTLDQNNAVARLAKRVDGAGATQRSDDETPVEVAGLRHVVVNIGGEVRRPEASGSNVDDATVDLCTVIASGLDVLREVVETEHWGGSDGGLSCCHRLGPFLLWPKPMSKKNGDLNWSAARSRNQPQLPCTALEAGVVALNLRADRVVVND